MTNPSNVMTMDEVSEYLKTPINTLRFWRQAGRGPTSFKIGRSVRYDRAEVERFLVEVRGPGVVVAPPSSPAYSAEIAALTTELRQMQVRLRAIVDQIDSANAGVV